MQDGSKDDGMKQGRGSRVREKREGEWKNEWRIADEKKRGEERRTDNGVNTESRTVYPSRRGEERFAHWEDGA